MDSTQHKNQSDTNIFLLQDLITDILQEIQKQEAFYRFCSAKLLALQQSATSLEINTKKSGIIDEISQQLEQLQDPNKPWATIIQTVTSKQITHLDSTQFKKDFVEIKEKQENIMLKLLNCITNAKRD